VRTIVRALVLIGTLSADHPSAGVARQATDFRRPDALADALLHPQDRAYTVPQLYAWLDGAEVSQLPLRGADPEQAATLLHHVDAGTAVCRVDH
jgi:hypothetical protein